MRTSILFLVAVFCLGAMAQAQDVKIESAPLKAAYIPNGYDDVNRVQIMVEGILPSSCFRSGPHKVSVNDGKVIVTQGVYHYRGNCSDIVTPYNEVVDLGIVPGGNYPIIDGVSGRPLGVLPVAKAPKKSPDTFPDDFRYAPVTDASVVSIGSLQRVVISGTFTDNCTHVSEIRANAYGNVIQVLPITTRAKTGCVSGLYRYQVSRQIVVPEGHYMLHVRSLSGNAISKIIDLYDDSSR